jgi:hypothetical protein
MSGERARAYTAPGKQEAWSMTKSIRLRPLVAIGLAGALLAAQATAQPTQSGTIEFKGGGVAFIGSVNWGSGTLFYGGKKLPIKVSGVGVGAIGAKSYSAVGDVYNLKSASDIEGTYTALEANATAGAGAGSIDMTNEKGVEIRAHSTSAGLNLSLAPTGMSIKLK